VAYFYKEPDPIKIGLYITDEKSPTSYINCFKMAFEEAYEAGRIGCPVELQK